MSQRRFKYQREDFGPMPVTLNHLDIHLSFLPDLVEGRICLDMTALGELDVIELDAKQLDIKRVERLAAPGDESGSALAHDYQIQRDKLIVTPDAPLKEGDNFLLMVECSCVPSDHILEGIYKDVTPAGAPQQYMSQFQQWGFQRVLPIFDDCRAKCTMTTTLEGDARYTHMISNGNIDRELCPQGRPVPKPGGPSRQIIRFINNVPMAPYLFIACAGTWDELADSVTLEAGNTVGLEYLVPAGQIDGVRLPMEICKDSVLWLERTQDYAYKGDTYRTICMSKSNFGGMENVGNTTIVTDAALVDEHTLDQMLLYAHAVIVHEFEHNQCGSETTMATPFDVWLNEAYTVDVERQYMADRFGEAFMRLRQVDSIRDPLLGPLALEDGGHVGRIVRDGFNDPDELIDGVTYLKAAEVIRMLRLVLGADDFRKGKLLYFSRYKDANADSDQFFQCFEEVSGKDLGRFKEQWLYTIGYPTVSAETSWDGGSGTYTVRLAQKNKPGVGPFHLPVAMALVNAQGKDIDGTARIFQLTGDSAEVEFEGLKEEPAFASINRDYSFYGVFEQEGLTDGDLARQAMLDPNEFNRVEALRRLTDRQRVRLLHDPAAQLDQAWIDVYGQVLTDETMPPALKAYFLRIEEQPMQRQYGAWLPELVAAQERMKQAVGAAWREEIIAAFQGLDTYGQGHTMIEGITRRMLKSALLDLICAIDEPRSHEIILAHYTGATTANDRISALGQLNRSSAPERLEVLEQAYEKMHGHLSGYANYLRVISSGTRPDVFEQIGREAKRGSFDVNQPTWCRALYVPMAANNKMLWTEQGINWLADRVIELGPRNPTTTSRMLGAFKMVAELREPLRGWTAAALERIAAGVGPDASPTVHGQAQAYLKGL